MNQNNCGYRCLQMISVHHTRRWQEDGPYVTQTMRHAAKYDGGKQRPEVNDFNCQIRSRSVNFVRCPSNPFLPLKYPKYVRTFLGLILSEFCCVPHITLFCGLELLKHRASATIGVCLPRHSFNSTICQEQLCTSI